MTTPVSDTSYTIGDAELEIRPVWSGTRSTADCVVDAVLSTYDSITNIWVQYDSSLATANPDHAWVKSFKS